MFMIRKINNIIRNIKHINFFWLIWGGIMACVFALPYIWGSQNGWMPEYKCVRLEKMLAEYTLNNKFDFSHIAHTLGYPLYYPIIMDMFHITSGQEMYSVCQAMFGILTIAFYPMLLYKIYDSVIVSALAPLLVRISFGDMLYIGKACDYWTSLWSIVAGIPILMLFMKSAKLLNKFILSVLISCVLMVSNAIRLQSALPLLIMFLAILAIDIMKGKNIKTTIISLVLAGVCILPYNMLSQTIPSIVADSWGFSGVSEYSTSPWHSLLIGLGSVENQYGLEYSDASGKEYIEKRYPNIEYLSDEYFYACKTEYWKIVKENPGMVLESYLIKFIKCIRMSLDYLLGNVEYANIHYKYYFLIASIFFGAIVLKKKSIVMRGGGRDILLLILIVGLSLYQGVLTHPWTPYLWGVIGGFGYIIFWIFALILGRLERQLIDGSITS